jgi:hypothetical protein
VRLEAQAKGVEPVHHARMHGTGPPWAEPAAPQPGSGPGQNL